jgi:hypothetical protein
MEPLAVEAVLVAEFGRTMTRAFLVDKVDGAYRFLARGEAISTQEPPHDDLTIGLQAAVQQVEYIAGRKLLKRDRLLMPQAANGDGLDSFVAVANVGDPWRLAVLDAGAGQREIDAIADATRRMETLVYTITPPGRGLKPAEWSAQHATALATWRPDTLLLVTGPNPAAEALSRMIGLIKGLSGPEVASLARLDEARTQAPVLAVTTETAFSQIAEQLATRSKLRLIAEPTPAALAERLAAELTKLADERAADRVQGFDAISSWSNAPIVNRQRAAGLVSQYLARSGKRRVALIDLDEAVGIHVATPDRLMGAVVADVDLALGITNLLGQTTAASLKRWLPFELSDAELAHWAINRSLRPLTVAVTMRDQLIEQAFAREALQLAMGRLAAGTGQGAELLIGSQWLARWGSLAAAAPVLLDGVLPAPETGAVTLALDPIGVLPAMGALAQVEGAAAAAVLEHDALTPLGTCLVVQGGNDGQRVVSGALQRVSGETTPFEVKAGGIAVLPLGVDEPAAIRLTIENRASLGAFRAGQTVQFEAPTHVRGGAIGLIIDARGRPLMLPEDGRRRQECLREWLGAFDLLPAAGGDAGF